MLGKSEQLWPSDEMVAISEESLAPWCVCRRCFDGCAAFRDECADYLVGMGKSSGSLTRKVLFAENDSEGVLAQIRDVDARTGKGENHLGKILMKIREELCKISAETANNK